MFFTQAAPETVSQSGSNIWQTESTPTASPWGKTALASSAWSNSATPVDRDAQFSQAGNVSASASCQLASEFDSSAPVCRFYAAGRCGAGDACRFSHPAHQDFGYDSFICGICSENVLACGRKFGLLENCDDVFCLDCLREWRNQKEKQDKANLRRCPLCRIESFVVIPSAQFLVGADKAIEKDNYCSYLASVPCKNFDFGKGKCPFGTSCLYKHDGEKPLSNFVVIKGADGRKTKKATQLSDFLRL